MDNVTALFEIHHGGVKRAGRRDDRLTKMPLGCGQVALIYKKHTKVVVADGGIDRAEPYRVSKHGLGGCIFFSIEINERKIEPRFAASFVNGQRAEKGAFGLGEIAKLRESQAESIRRPFVTVICKRNGPIKIDNSRSQSAK